MSRSEHEPDRSTTSLLARDAERRELGWTTLRRCREKLSRLVARNRRLVPPGIAPDELVDTAIDAVGGVVARGGYQRREGRSGAFLLTILRRRSCDLFRTLARRARLGRPDRIETLGLRDPDR